MPGQIGQECTRYGSKLLGGIKSAADGIRGRAEEVGKEVVKVAHDLKGEVSQVADALRGSGERGAEWVTQKAIPGATQGMRKAAEVVVAHGSITARRFSAGIREFASAPEDLERSRTSTFNLAKLLVNNRVSMVAAMRNFVGSDAALIAGFDTADKAPRGIPVYPQHGRLQHVTREYIPVRVFISDTGLRSRTYEQISPEEACALKQQYRFIAERPTTADDLFQLRITPEQIETAINLARASDAFAPFRPAKGQGGAGDKKVAIP